VLENEDGRDAEGSSNEFDEVVPLTKNEGDDETGSGSNGSDEEEGGD
jgi:hypothetical protein